MLKGTIFEKTAALMREKGLSFLEARAELGRRGAAARAGKARRRKFRVEALERRGLA